jgi:hypothetical protein
MASSTVRERDATPPAAAARADETRDEPSGLRVVEAPTREARRSPTLARIAVTRAPSQQVLEVRASRAPSHGPVLVLSLDPALVQQASRELAGVRAVVRVGSQAELVRAMTLHRTRGFCVLVDSALPSVDLPAFAALSSLLPPGTRVVLWGTSERQKNRLVGVFPQVAAWIASGDAASLQPLLGED